MNPLSLLFCIIICMCIIGWAFWDNPRSRRALRMRRRHFLHRASTPLNEWYQLYWQPEGVTLEDVVSVLSILATQLQCSVVHFYPSDRFDKELRYTGPRSFGIGIDSDDAEMFDFWTELDEMLNIESAASRLPDEATLLDLIKACHPPEIKKL